MSAETKPTEPKMVNIYIMNKKYQVPEGLTIMKAFEYAGYQLIRGVGCRGGFCGACATVYRILGNYKLQVGLACQTVVQENMYLTQIPFFPANKALYNIMELSPKKSQVIEIYPEVLKCLGCNSCRKVCPQQIEVMEYMSAAIRGDYAKAADLSFDCLMCGLCASRCPSENVQYNIGMLCRRLYGKYIAPKAQHLADRVKEIEEGKFDKELAELMKSSTDKLKARHEFLQNKDREAE